MIEILIIDDHPLLCEVLQSRLEVEKDFKVVGRFYDGEAAIEQVKKLQPDIVLIDVEMPKMDGFTATRIITQNNPKTKVIILTAHTDEIYLKKALEAGAKSYLPKNTTAEDLKNVILSVYHDDSQISRQIWEKFRETLEEMQLLIDTKFLENQEEFQKSQKQFQKNINRLSQQGIDLYQKLEYLQDNLESKYQYLEEEFNNFTAKTNYSLQNLNINESEYSKNLKTINKLKIDFKNTLNQLNEAGFNPDNFNKFYKLEEQVKRYKTYVHELRRQENEVKKNSSVSLFVSFFALFLSSLSLFLNFLLR